MSWIDKPIAFFLAAVIHKPLLLLLSDSIYIISMYETYVIASDRHHNNNRMSTSINIFVCCKA